MEIENIDIGKLKKDEIMPAFAHLSKYQTNLQSKKQKLKLTRDKDFAQGIILNITAGTMSTLNMSLLAPIFFIPGIYKMYLSAKSTNKLREENDKLVHATMAVERLQGKLKLYENMFATTSQNPKINPMDIRNAIIESFELQEESKKTRKTYAIAGAVFAASALLPILAGVNIEDQTTKILILSSLAASGYSFTSSLSNISQMDNEKEKRYTLEAEDTLLTIEKTHKILKKESIRKIQRVGQIDDTLYDLEEPNIR